jgi:hypothetical protein
MQLFIVNWVDRESKRLATSSYSSALRKYKELEKRAKNNPDISVGEIDQAIKRVDVKKKEDVISLINGE